MFAVSLRLRMCCKACVCGRGGSYLEMFRASDPIFAERPACFVTRPRVAVRRSSSSTPVRHHHQKHVPHTKMMSNAETESPTYAPGQARHQTQLLCCAFPAPPRRSLVCGLCARRW